MGEMTARLLVIGGGPGGYTAAVRAGQLGCDTVLVEQARPGGTCLNIGCIPSKALIHVAEAFEHAARQAHASSFGLRVGAPSLDFARAIAWKDGIVSRLNAGVAALLKGSGVRTVQAMPSCSTARPAAWRLTQDRRRSVPSTCCWRQVRSRWNC